MITKSIHHRNGHSLLHRQNGNGHGAETPGNNGHGHNGHGQDSEKTNGHGPNGHSLHCSVLALNRSFEAVHVISAKRAFCLLYKNLAEVISVDEGMYMAYDFSSWLEISELKASLDEISPHDDWLQAVNFAIQVPRVVRLVKYDRFPRNAVKFNRRNVFLRDENCCQYCGNHYGTQNLSLDHVVPRTQGGMTTWENVVCACLRCNVRKGGRTPQEAGMLLKTVPVKPKRNPVLAYQLSTPKYACWRKFVD
ncbi:MAG: HNH endonuclease [Planctomycetaceae bacterium]